MSDKLYNTSFEAFTAVMFQVEVFWVVTQCSVMVGYQPFRGPCCLHLQPEDLDLKLFNSKFQVYKSKH